MDRTVAARKRARPPAVALRRYEVISNAIEAAASIGRTAMVCGTVAFLGTLLYLVLVSYAGRYTFANVAITVAANFGIDRYFAYGFGIAGIGYGLRERQFRRRNIERLTKRTIDLERTIDPNRTSSGLTPLGTTHPGDR